MSFSAVPLGQKFTAVLVAAAAAYGAYTWLERRAVETTSTAELSFSLHAARRLDTGFVHANEPAVVFANSVLSDQRIAELSKPAFLSTSGMMSRVGEFRSRLELTQPSPEVLRVRFRDADASKGVQTANAVADALVAWSPSPDAPSALTEPAPAAPAQPVAQQPSLARAETPKAAAAPAPVKKPAVAAEEGNSGSSAPLVAALGQLQAQLSSTSRDVQEGAAGGQARPGYEGRAYAESEQQHLLKNQVRDAEKKVTDLRAQYGNGAEGKHLGAIQQALASVLAGGGVGVSASQLRREREGLTRAMSVVEQERAAIQKESATESAGTAATQPPASSASNAATATPASAPSGNSAANPITEKDLTQGGSPPPSSSPAATATSQPGPDSSAAPESLEDPSLANPFRMEKPAGSPMAVQWWQAAAAGVGCGLLYWILIAMISGRREDEAYVEDTVSYGRFITPAAPMPDIAPAPAPTPATEPVTAEVASREPSRRASFTYDPGPVPGGPGGEHRSLGERAAAVQVQQPRVESSPVASIKEPTAENTPDESSATRDVFHQDKPDEKVVQIDPWTDLMQKALSETDIGRKFETQKDRSEGAATETSPLRPDRLAG